MTFLKIVVKYGWIYVQSLTYKNLTDKFPVDIKGCHSSLLPFWGPFHFSSLPYYSPPFCPPQCQAISTLLWRLPVERLGFSGKSVVSIEKK